MGLVNAEIKMQGNDNAFFTTNAAVVYPANIQIFHTDGRYKFTDGTTALSALPFLGSGGSGVQSVTGNSVDNSDSLNPVVNNLGLIKIIDPNNDFFTDLATASAYIRTHIDENTYPITNESFELGIYYFTVPQNTECVLSDYFLGDDTNTITASFIDEIGLITKFGDKAFKRNYGNNYFVNVEFENTSATGSLSPFAFFGGENSINNLIVTGTQWFAGNSTGKFIFRGNIGSTEGVNYTSFFSISTATILATAPKYTSNSGAIQGDLQTAISNGANVQFDGINFTNVHNDLTGLNDGDYKHLTAAEYAKLFTDVLITKGGSTTNTLATGVDIPDLTFAMEANTEYFIEGKIRVSCSSTGGNKFATTVPLGTTFIAYYFGKGTSSTTTREEVTVGSGTLTVTAHNTVATTSTLLDYHAHVVTGGTAGNWTLQIASGVATQTSTVHGIGTSVVVKKKV